MHSFSLPQIEQWYASFDIWYFTQCKMQILSGEFWQNIYIYLSITHIKMQNIFITPKVSVAIFLFILSHVPIVNLFSLLHSIPLCDYIIIYLLIIFVFILLLWECELILGWSYYEESYMLKFLFEDMFSLSQVNS